MKTKYIIAILISVGIFNSCSGVFINAHKPDQLYLPYYPISNTAYGSYLAARVAHIRQDYDKAADYYIKSVNLGADEPELLSRIYLLLTTKGRIDEAAVYAKKAIKDGDNSNFVRFVIMSSEAKNQNYDKAIEIINTTDKAYKKSITPLLKAWLIAGKKDKQQALKELEILKKEKSLLSLYYMQRGLINDYFKDTESAQKDFDMIVNDNNLEISFRSLQLITNFYTRNSQKEKAEKLIIEYDKRYVSTKMFTELLRFAQNTESSRTIPLIDTPQKGLGEALFNIGVFFRDYQTDIAQIFTTLSLYLNPDNDIAQISQADLFEKTNRYDEALEQYQMLSSTSPLYYMANLKIISMFLEQKNYSQALKKLENLNKIYPKDYNILFNLGEAYRLIGNNKKAIKYYNTALNNLPASLEGNWMIYYVLGVVYEKNNQWVEAEQALKQALKISNRHPYVLNFLGYVWLENNKNYNEALYMIFEAYHQNPENGHIMDSVGWALYRMGKYNDAMLVLEKAAEYLPTNAVVCDHLGDVYWQIGRKNEAKYQWKHALNLEEDADLIDKTSITKKISEGIEKPTAIIFNEALLIERLKTLNSEE